MDWDKILFSEQSASFLPEVALRTVVMFLVILIGLKCSGKRGVRQLSVFELVIIIGLGSAAGDPMFYEEVGLIPAIVVFAVVILSYRAVTWIVGKSKRVEQFIEGRPIYLINEGKFSVGDFRKEDLSQDEFFAELRLRGVDHLGQVRCAIMETTGDMSVFFFADDEMRPGLPILPHLYEQKSTDIGRPGVYACAFCGNTRHLANPDTCEICGRPEWVPALDIRRIG